MAKEELEEKANLIFLFEDIFFLVDSRESIAFIGSIFFGFIFLKSDGLNFTDNK